jgi:hypothetical protein
MTSFRPAVQQNPLASYMRQPKIYIKLPSGGAFWEHGSIDIPETGEFAVYSMTAKDELTFKTPDALMNGQAVVDVIQSCIPSIKNAWATPNLDLDLLLIAIRIATYGESMEIEHKVPVADERVSHIIDLRMIVDQILNNSRWDDSINIGQGMTCFIKPLTYRHVTKTSLKTFETQRLMQAVNDDTLSNEQKLEIFNKSFKEMSDVTIDLIVDSIVAIKVGDQVVQERSFILEFVQNADSEIIQRIQDHIAEMKKVSGIQPLTITSTDEHREKGAPDTYELPITMDNSSFFARGS